MYKDETKYSSIVFSLDDYKWNNTIEEAKVEMWKDISTQLQLLLKNGYIAVIRDDDCDIIAIDYEHDENKDSWGCSNPRWLTDEEWETVCDSRYFDEEEDSNKLPEYQVTNTYSDNYDYWDGPEKRKLKVKPFKETLRDYSCLKIKK